MNDIWLVRAGPKAVHIDEFQDKGIIAVGAGDMRAAEALGEDRPQLISRMAGAHPDWSERSHAIIAGQVHRFVHDIAVGDDVITYEPSRRIYMMGKVVSDARHDPTVIGELPYVRDVDWSSEIPRDELSVPTRNSLGAIQAIIQLNARASTELRTRASGLESTPPARLEAASDDDSDEAADLASLRQETVEKSGEFIEDMIADLDPYQMQDLVAGILRAMGYKTRVAAPGADRGVDITASPDGLGLQEPRIFVEVKHRTAPMGSQALRTFLGGRQAGDRCLYVSSGGFTREARYEAERSTIPLTLIDLPMLRELLTEHYEALDVETKQMVPLTRVYWPVGS